MRNLTRFVTFLLLWMANPAKGQNVPEQLTNAPGTWSFTNDNLSNEWYAERFYQLNTAEQKKYHTTVDSLVKFLHNQPIAQNPVGITLMVQAKAFYDHYDHAAKPVSPAEKVKAEIFIRFCNLVRKNGATECFCVEVPYLKLRTNDQPSAYEPAMTLDPIADKQVLKRFREILIQPKKLLDLGSEVYLMDGYNENRVVVARKERPLFLPLTCREYLNRLLAYYTASCKENSTPQMALDALKAEINAIPADILDQQAYLNGNPQRPLTQLCTMEEDSTTALCRINPDYFDPTLPRTTVQLITLSIPGHLDDPYWGDYNAHQLWKYISGLKGEELRSLLDSK